MDWRGWAWETLQANTALLAVVPATSMYGAGSLANSPAERPFIILRFEDTVNELMEGENAAATSRGLTVWVHDDPGSYVRIDTIIALVSAALCGQVFDPTAISCTSQGSSSDLADDTYGTITRNASFRLLGGSE